jgi:iron(III) transport system permease protein
MSGRALINTVLLVVCVAALVLFFSTITSWIVVRTRLWGRRGIDAVVTLPMTIPHLAFAFALSYAGLYMAQGFPIYGTLAAIIISHTIAFISFGTRTVNGTLIQIHRDLEEAVLTSGGSRLVALRRVVLPLLAPALFYAGVWVALLSYREVTMALFLQSPRNQVLSTAIWNLWDSNNPADAAAMGVLMFFTVMALLVAAQRGAKGILYGMEVR